jgi:hypothetical protein
MGEDYFKLNPSEACLLKRARSSRRLSSSASRVARDRSRATVTSMKDARDR